MAKGGQTDAVNGSRRRHAAQGADSSDRGWRVVGVDDVQVGRFLRQERRWLVGSTDRGDTTTDGYLWRGGGGGRA